MVKRQSAFCMNCQTSDLSGNQVNPFRNGVIFFQPWYFTCAGISYQLNVFSYQDYIPLNITCIESLGGSFLLCYSVTCIPGHVYVQVRICCR